MWPIRVPPCTMSRDWHRPWPLCCSRRLHPPTRPTNTLGALMIRVGINGFGRIGRSFYRALLARGADAGVDLVAVNDPMGDSDTMAFLLKHDSVGGTLRHEVKASDAGFSVDGREVRKLEVMDPAEIPWGDHGVEV